MIRPGLLAIGVSGERTDEAGADALAAMYRGRGWSVVTCSFDPHFLHLDTQFCMVGERLALACTDVLDDRFIALLGAEGIDLVEVSYKEARRLGCNILSLGDRRVLSAGTAPRVDHALVARGYRVMPIDLGEFVQCGGGVHCLTRPLKRAAG
jgi:N-dimethylarginine dimethylaminohydrolase